MNDESVLIAARKRLDDAIGTLQYLAVSNTPVMAEDRAAFSERKALADLEYTRAKAAYEYILAGMTSAPHDKAPEELR